MALMHPLLPPAATGPVPHSDREAHLARESSQAIAGFINGDTTLNVTFTRESGERLEATLPASAVKLLAQVLGDMAQGTPLPRELTTHQAAALLQVSRPFLIKLLDQGAIPHRKVGRHRRIRYDDLQTYLERETAARRETLRELAAYDQEIGLSDFDTIDGESLPGRDTTNPEIPSAK